MRKVALIGLSVLTALFVEAAGPKVSILGDSYSTFTGYVTPAGNAVWYHAERKTAGLESVEQTWWMQVIKGMGGTLEVNNSFSGSTICSTGYGGKDCLQTCFVTRAEALGKPDVILVCGGTNDAWAQSPIGEFKYNGWKTEDLKSFRPACAKMLVTLKKKYPQAKIVFVLNSGIGSVVPASVAEICKHYQIPVVNIPESCEKMDGHPTVAGMKAISEAVLAYIQKNARKYGVKANKPTRPASTRMTRKASAGKAETALGVKSVQKAIPDVLTAEDSKTTIGSPRYLPLRWLSLGTSITWYNSHAGGLFQKGYQSWLMDQIKFAGFTNKGISGACLKSTLWCIEDADLYTIEHGINDWGNRVAPGTMADYEHNTDNGTFAATYRQIIDKLRATNPKATIILCTPRKGYGFGDYLPATCDAQQRAGDDGKPGYYLREYAELVRAIAKKENLPLADFYATCGEQDELAGLSIDVALHPNDAGYQRMANILAKTMMKVFPDAELLKDKKMIFTDDGTAKDVVVTKFLSSTEQVVLKGTDIAKVKVTSAKLGGGWVPGGPYDCQVHFEDYDPETKTYTCQLQSCSPQDKCMRVIAIELKQEFNGDVLGRVLWNRYRFNCEDYGINFATKGNYHGGCASASDYSNQGYVIGRMTLSVNK
ncbi:MAG: SGNH/GDSL hydrolase family protein [Kiritimatiellia bacterium]